MPNPIYIKKWFTKLTLPLVRISVTSPCEQGKAGSVPSAATLFRTRCLQTHRWGSTEEPRLEHRTASLGLTGSQRGSSTEYHLVRSCSCFLSRLHTAQGLREQPGGTEELRLSPAWTRTSLRRLREHGSNLKQRKAPQRC